MRIKKKELMKLEQASYEDKKKLIDSMPSKYLSWIYVNYCTQDQLNQLFEEYDSILTDDKIAKNLGKIDKIRKKYKKKMKSLINGLKKARQTTRIPYHIRKKYCS